MTVPLPMLVALTVFAAIGLACVGLVAVCGYRVWLEHEAERVRA